MNGNEIKLYLGACGFRNGNAGDEYALDVVAHLSGRKVIRCETIVGAELIASGSLAEHFDHNFGGIVWGTGIILEHTKMITPNTPVLALRGKLTLRRWESYYGTVAAIGDPGLLADEVYGIQRNLAREPRYKVGLVVHYVDEQDEVVLEWARKWRDDVVVISMCDRPEIVVEMISRCACVLSSSLHGLIFADALGVPNQWVVLSDKLAGGSFKFRDYYSAFGIDDPLARSFGVTAAPDNIYETAINGYERPGLAEIKQALRESFPFPKER